MSDARSTPDVERPTGGALPIAALKGLRDKYQRMLEMRRAHESGSETNPRTLMRVLAAQYPGALRELDELPLSLIEIRIGALTEVIEAGVEVAPWMRWMVDYHGYLRAALRIKRMGLPRDDMATALTQLHQQYVPAIDEPPVSLLNDEALAVVLKPTQGRLNPWVFGQIAVRHGTDAEVVRSQLFPGSRSPQ